MLDHVNVRVQGGVDPRDDREMEGSVCCVVYTLLQHLSQSLAVIVVPHEDNGRGKMMYGRARLATFLYRTFDEARYTVHVLRHPNPLTLTSNLIPNPILNCSLI